jgi:phage terminase small subunit
LSHPILPNQRHERFAQEVAQGKSAGEAYRLAGYRAANHSAETAGSRLLKNVEVQQRIVELQQKVARKVEITLESLLREAADIQTAAISAKQYAAANGALKLKAELSGHYVLRKQDVTPRRSEAEIDARLRELLAGGDQAGSSGPAGTAPKLRSPTQLN